MSIGASKLVKEVLHDLADSTRTSYLITLNRFVNEFVRDKHYGFEAVEICTVPGSDVTLWAMLRKKSS